MAVSTPPESAAISASDRSSDDYFSGARLYGDDFNAAQIAEWYAEEEEGYARLGAGNAANYKYEYHAWNRLHGFRFLHGKAFEQVMGFGSAYGEELEPVLDRVGRLVIVDPSQAFVRESVHGVPVTYVKPAVNGALPFADNQFDLVSCLGVLHHIPNVSFVVKELARTTRPGGLILLREPIVSMGDWRQPRAGVTRNERGIPLGILRNIIRDAGLETVNEDLCGFAPTEPLYRLLRRDFYNSAFFSRVDSILSRLFAWNVNYHPTSFFRRFRPTSAYLLLKKPGSG